LSESGRAGHQPRRRAGRDDQVVPRDLVRAAVLEVDAERLAVLERAPAVDLGDLVLLHQEVDALDDGVRHLPAAGMGRRVVHRRVAGDPEEVLLVAEDVRQLGVPEQCLGRDAADVEAHTAPVLLLDDGNALAELGSADGGDVPTGARTEDDEVEVAHEPEPIPLPGVVRQPDAHASVSACVC
jgi:hypothetical protein